MPSAVAGWRCGAGPAVERRPGEGPRAHVEAKGLALKRHELFAVGNEANRLDHDAPFLSRRSGRLGPGGATAPGGDDRGLVAAPGDPVRQHLEDGDVGRLVPVPLDARRGASLQLLAALEGDHATGGTGCPCAPRRTRPGPGDGRQPGPRSTTRPDARHRRRRWGRNRYELARARKQPSMGRVQVVLGGSFIPSQTRMAADCSRKHRGHLDCLMGPGRGAAAVCLTLRRLATGTTPRIWGPARGRRLDDDTVASRQYRRNRPRRRVARMTSVMRRCGSPGYAAAASRNGRTGDVPPREDT